MSGFIVNRPIQDGDALQTRDQMLAMITKEAPMTTDRPMGIEVTQADVDLANRIVDGFRNMLSAAYIAPATEGHWLTATVARHRQSSIASLTEAPDAVREAWKADAALVFSPTAKEDGDGYLYEPGATPDGRNADITYNERLEYEQKILDLEMEAVRLRRSLAAYSWHPGDDT